ncbi:MAG: hypothetical protein JWO67_283 [Streptosporangiaceae bacterium]|jgi:hypothetical protein|nr:hypothetical protein [Streptosporangiaceae bacterium]
MPRSVGLVLVGVGAFVLALAPLLRFYVAGQVIAAPRNYYQSTRLEARNASYFDPAELKLRTGVTLMARTNVRGDVEGVSDPKIAVWDSSTAIFDLDRNKPIEAQDYRIAFDRRTSRLVACCGAHVSGDTSVRFSGYGLMFPVAGVRKRDYPFFDVTMRRAVPMRFAGEDRVKGLKTYRFVQEIEPAKVARVASIPGRLLGLGAKSGNVEADRYYSAKTTVWVDPRTGIPVKHLRALRTTVRTPDGKGTLTTASADLLTVDADQRKLVDEANRNALMVGALRTYGPVAALGSGLILLLAGGVIAVRGRTPARPTAGTTLT